VNFHEWSGEPGNPGRVIDLRRAGALDFLVNRYAKARPAVMRQVLTQAYNLGAQMAVIEYRYLDPDYRNEHSRFYSGTFRRYPSVAHRLHFFDVPPPKELEDPDKPAKFGPEGYLGYSVMRPVAGGPVGRTMLRAPASLETFVSCRAKDKVNLFGIELSTDAAPFIAQDAQLSVCAHATLWVIAYYHYLKYQSPRRLPGEIADAVPSAVGFGRPMPSPGLTVNQLTEASRLIGLPSLLYRLRGPGLLPGETVYSLACRYLNSGMPVIIGGGGHAFTLVGYQPYFAPDGSKRIRFIRQDDETGPYQLVDNASLDYYSPWEVLVVPLPPKVYLSAEKAEALGVSRLRSTLIGTGDDEDAKLVDRINRREVRFRTTLVRSNDFKTGLIGRGMDEATATIYQRIGMSRWIWVVEATDATERDLGNDCTLAEAVIDATDHLRDLHVLAWRIPKTVYQWLPDQDSYLVYRKLANLPMLTCLSRVSQKVV
jgi:hypothetical protein